MFDVGNPVRLTATKHNTPKRERKKKKKTNIENREDKEGSVGGCQQGKSSLGGMGQRRQAQRACPVYTKESAVTSTGMFCIDSAAKEFIHSDINQDLRLNIPVADQCPCRCRRASWNAGMGDSRSLSLERGAKRGTPQEPSISNE